MHEATPPAVHTHCIGVGKETARNGTAVATAGDINCSSCRAVTNRCTHWAKHTDPAHSYMLLQVLRTWRSSTSQQLQGWLKYSLRNMCVVAQPAVVRQRSALEAAASQHPHSGAQSATHSTCRTYTCAHAATRCGSACPLCTSCPPRPTPTSRLHRRRLAAELGGLEGGYACGAAPSHQGVDLGGWMRHDSQQQGQRE